MNIKPSQEPQRLNISLPECDIEGIQWIIDDAALPSSSDVIREAIRLTQHILKEVNKGKKVFIGETREKSTQLPLFTFSKF